MVRIWLTTILFIGCRGIVQMHRCPSNLIRSQYLKTFGEKCYQFNSEESTWFSANESCAVRGGLLLQTRTANIQQFVMEFLQSLEWSAPVWIGAYEETFSTRWKWIEGNPLVYSNWAPGEPSRCFACPFYWECAWLQNSDGGRWQKHWCTTDTFSFICEFDMIPMKLPSTTLSTDVVTSQIQSTVDPSTVSISSAEQVKLPSTILSKDVVTSQIQSTTEPSTVLISSEEQNMIQVKSSSIIFSKDIVTSEIQSTTDPSTVLKLSGEQDMSPVKSSSTVLSKNVVTSPIRSTINPSTVFISSGEQNQIVAILLSLILVVFIAGFVSACCMVAKRGRKNHPNQEKPVNVNKKRNVPRVPDLTHVELNKISKNDSIYDEIPMPLEEYEELNTASAPETGLRNSYTRLTQQDIYLTPINQEMELEELTTVPDQVVCLSDEDFIRQ